MYRYTLALTSIAILSVGYLLEREGVFLYFGYTVVKICASVCAGSLAMWGIARLTRQQRVEAAVALLLCPLFLISGWALESAVTGPRKQFCLLAERVKPGDSLDNVKRSLTGYRHWSTQDGQITFQFARPGTSDVLVLHYDPKTLKILEARLSLD